MSFISLTRLYSIIQEQTKIQIQEHTKIFLNVCVICFSGGTGNRRLRFLRRPFLVMSPIGILTSMELIFALMFGALLIWSLSNYLHISFEHLHMHKEG